MPAQKRSTPSGPEEERRPTSAVSEGAVWTTRRADLEWRSQLERVTMTHRLHAATAVTEYQRAVLQITQEAAEREAEALSRMESESRRQEASIEDRLASARELQERLLAGRQSSEAALRGTARRLAEELQRAWLEALDGYQEAHAQYQRALQATLATSAMPGASPWVGAADPQFAVAADEGPALAWSTGVIWPDVWGSTSWNPVGRW